MVTDWVRATEMVNGRGSAKASEWASSSTCCRQGTNQWKSLWTVCRL